MILDARAEFCDATSIASLTASASWQNIGNVYDRQASTNTTVDLGLGRPVWLLIVVQTGITVNSSTGTIAFRLVSDTSDNPPHASTSTVHYTSSTYTTATTATTLAAGSVIARIALPSGSYERYLGIQALVSTTNLNAGKMDAFLTMDPAVVKHYEDAL